MDKHTTFTNKQAGAMLLEALISILIFSIGILAIVGLQAASVKNASDAKYRSTANLLANELLARMWTSDRTQTTLQTNFQSSGVTNTEYKKWLPDVYAALPGVSGVAANKPIVAISAVSATAVTSSHVTITIYWNSPTESPKAHKYTAVAQII